MSESILENTKKVLGIDPSYDVFDMDVMMHINSAFSTLSQLGIGPDEGFMIEDADATWDEFLDGDPNLNSVKSYIYLRVRMLFDPPTTSFALDSMKTQVTEFEWRLNAYREGRLRP